MHPEFAHLVQIISDGKGSEVEPKAIREAFEQEYLCPSGPLAIRTWSISAAKSSDPSPAIAVEAQIAKDGTVEMVRGSGNGPVDAFTHALQQTGLDFTIADYAEHALSKGSDSTAVAYVKITYGGDSRWGAGMDESIDAASFKAIISGLNRTMEGTGK
jgi:2-isopropylmalate synthase